MKNKIFIVLFSFFLLVSTLPSLLAEPAESDRFNPHTEPYTIQKVGNNVFFHGTTTQPDSSWYIVRFSGNETMYLNSTNYTIFSCTPNASSVLPFWGEPDWLTLTNFHNLSDSVQIIWSFSYHWESYLQMGNYVKNRLRPHKVTTQKTGQGFGPGTLSPGDYYMIYIVFPYTEGKIEAFINLSSLGAIRFFTPTEGRSFLYENQDFSGNLVYKRAGFPMQPLTYKSIILNGEKDIHVNNTFFGWFYSAPSAIWQRTRFQVITPDNEEYNALVKIKSFIFINYTGDFNPFGSYFYGGNGTWKFKTNQMGVSSFKLSGNSMDLQYVRIFGADLRLPDTLLGEKTMVPPTVTPERLVPSNPLFYIEKPHDFNMKADPLKIFQPSLFLNKETCFSERLFSQ